MLTLIRRPFHPYVTAVERRKCRPFCQVCGLNTKTSLTQRSRCGLTMLSTHSVQCEPIRETRVTRNSSSHSGLVLASPLKHTHTHTHTHARARAWSHTHRGGLWFIKMIGQNLAQNPCMRRKGTIYHFVECVQYLS